jgi:hypothetical protein
MNEPLDQNIKQISEGNGDVDPRDIQSKTILKAFGLGIGLVAFLFLGGIGIAWLLQGPVFFEEKALEIEATIKGNGVGALGVDVMLVAEEKARAGFVDKRHWLVLSYPGCEDAVQGFWIPDAPQKGGKQAGLLNELRTCFLPLQPGQTQSVKLITRRNRSTDERSWRVQAVGDCDASQIETLITPKPDAHKCDWM